MFPDLLNFLLLSKCCLLKQQLNGKYDYNLSVVIYDYNGTPGMSEWTICNNRPYRIYTCTGKLGVDTITNQRFPLIMYNSYRKLISYIL